MKKNQLRNIVKKIDCTGYLDYRLFLAQIYSQAKLEDREYSYAKFSEDLEVGSRNAHLIIHGKRNLTLKAAKKISENLKIIKDQRKYFLALIEYSLAKNNTEQTNALEKMQEIKSKKLPTSLEKEQLEFFSKWYFAAVLELLRLEDAQDKPEWISKHLTPKISLTEAKRSITLLNSLGYIDYSEERKRLYPTETTISTGNETYGLSITSFHQQMADLGKLALTATPSDKRQISALTISVNQEQYEEIKDEINALRKKIIQISHKDQNQSQVVQVNFQLFPLADIEADQ